MNLAQQLGNPFATCAVSEIFCGSSTAQCWQRLINPFTEPSPRVKFFSVAALGDHRLYLADQSLHADDSLSLARIEIFSLFDLSKNDATRQTQGVDHELYVDVEIDCEVADKLRRNWLMSNSVRKVSQGLVIERLI